jgi:hypothetical protein
LPSSELKNEASVSHDFSGMLPVSAVALAQGYIVSGSDDAQSDKDIHLQGLKLLQGRLQVGIISVPSMHAYWLPGGCIIARIVSVLAERSFY